MAVEIAGFSDHAWKRMKERGITRWAVEDACRDAGVPQPNGCTRYVGSSCTVIVNANNWVVTVF